MVAVKVCGITRIEDALLCIDAGVDALGLNFHPASPRFCSRKQARAIVDAVAGRVLTVGVTVDLDADALTKLLSDTGVACLQLHGDEPPDLLARFLPHAYKALRVRGPEVTAEALRYGGEYILLDAHVPGRAGGTGARFDWSLARDVAAVRKLALAGGLTPDNVEDAVARVQPYCVDVASGVESAPGIKDPEQVRRFVERAKA